MKYKIGLDIGATKIMGILWDGKSVFYSIKILTSKNKKKFLFDLFEIIFVLVDLVGKNKILGINIAVAGILDNNGKMLKSPNLPSIENLNLKNLVSRKFKKPVKIINDAKAFLLAESKLGAGMGYKNPIALTLGSGVGGAHVYAGEFGHMIIDKNLSLENLVKNRKKMGYYLGIGLANLSNIFEPDIIILGGGLSKAAKLFLPQTKLTMRKFIMSPMVKKVRIKLSKLGDEAVAIGATLIR